jgi:hypothetical protein
MTSTLPIIRPEFGNNRRIVKPVGQKAPLHPKEVWAIRVRLQLASHLNTAGENNGCDEPHDTVTSAACGADQRLRARRLPAHH